MIEPDLSPENASRPRTRRMTLYWAVTTCLYCLALCAIWIDVGLGNVSTSAAVPLSLLILAGTLPVYALIRCMARLRMRTSQLATLQGLHGILCIALSYAVLGPMRPIALLPLPLVLLLCAFSVRRSTSYALSAFAVLAVGAAMLWLRATDAPGYPLLHEAMYLVATASVLGVAVFLGEQFNRMRDRLRVQTHELSTALTSLQSLAFRDELTKLPNRRYMKDLLASEERRHAHDNSPLSVALLDIDYFKRVNDQYGHLVGDETLCKFADLMNGALRQGDVLARWGGEEFLMLLPQTEPATALAVLHRLQELVAEHHLQIGEAALRITFSAGLAVVLPGESSLDAVNLADKAMFEAKTAGRNAIRQFVPQ